MQKKSLHNVKASSANLTLWRSVGALILLLTIAALTFAVPGEQWQTLLQNLLDNQGWRTSLILFVAYTSAVVFLLPLSPFAISAGLFLGFWQGSLISLIAINTGALLSFMISRRWFRRGYFRKAFQSSSMRLLTSNDVRVISLLRMNPLVPFSFHNYLYGAARTKLRPYLWGTFLGSAPFTLVLVYVGVTGRAIYRAGVSLGGWDYTMIGIGIVLSVLLLALTKYAKSSSHLANKE